MEKSPVCGDASFRLAFLKARLSDSVFSRRAFQIWLSDGRLSDSLSERAPFRFEFFRNRLTGSKLLRNHLPNHRYSYTLDSVPLHSAQPAPIME